MDCHHQRDARQHRDRIVRQPQGVAAAQQGQHAILLCNAVDGSVKRNRLPGNAIWHRECAVIPQQAKPHGIRQQRHATGCDVAQVHPDARHAGHATVNGQGSHADLIG